MQVLLGSMDANRGDYQNGWDTDQFPNNINELAEAMLVILKQADLKVAVSISMQRSGETQLTLQICFMHILVAWMHLQEH